jgi:predicted Holliday junction resolvase-like endonuclease
MKLAEDAKEIIHTMEENRFYAECPCCGEPILLRDAGLFYLDDFSPEAEELYKQRLDELREQEREIRERRKEISRGSEVKSTAVNIGFILERIAPCMKDFCFERNDCRSLFDPIDYVIFEGLTRKEKVSKILFVDIKTGKANLTGKQKEIRDLVEDKKVTWDTYPTEVGE